MTTGEEQTRRFQYEGHARTFAFYGIHDADVFACRCGWAGTTQQCVRDWFTEVVDGSCPKCETMLWIRNATISLSEVRAAAAAGDPRAVSELAKAEAREAERVRRRARDLKADSPLPDLSGDPLGFAWDFEEVDGEGWSVLRAGDAELWREHHAYGTKRLVQVEAILRARYGARFGALTMTPAAVANTEWP